MASLLEVVIADHVAHLTFNRPERRNAFNNELMHEALRQMAALGQDNSVRAIIVSGAGETFSAGFDLKAAAERDMSTVAHIREQMNLQFDFITQFWSSPKPTIAAVRGYCLAGAFELSLACDLTVAAEDAMFGEPEVRFGTGAVAMLFPWLTTPKLAKEIVLTGADRIPASRAYEMGVVNRVVASDRVLDTARSLARSIAQSSAVSVQKSKEAINRAYDIMGMRQALAAGLDLDVEINATPSFEKTEFARIRKEQGLKAAIAWRDGRFTN
mgnify:CR=1 FL=1